MHIRARLYGDLVKYATDTKPYQWLGELAEGSTVTHLFSAIGCTEKEVVRILRNGIPITIEEQLQDGDVIYLLTRLGIG
ncbi:MAG: hypothetical protein GXY60_07550 [Spirochaetales bacterium]|nr:hypothetical protein [Spirochaetales bacterium]